MTSLSEQGAATRANNESTLKKGNDLSAAFADQFGELPDGVWQAPGRVNLMGEHTDYNGGFVLPFAINKSCRAAISVRRDRQVHLISALNNQREIVADLDAIDSRNTHGWSSYPLGIAWAMEQEGINVPGFNLMISSDIPVGAGLSSSAALECAVGVGLTELSGTQYSRSELVILAHRAENDFVGAPTGIMDQTASLLGKAGSAVFLDCQSTAASLVPLDLQPAGLVCLVIDTKVSHTHATGNYADQRASCERNAATLGVASLRELTIEDLPDIRRQLNDESFRRVRHILTENERVLRTVQLLNDRGPSAIGEVLNASHASMREDFNISCPELDLAVETAESAGAIGARMTGGGFGGSAIALVPENHTERLQTAVRKRFTVAGYNSPDIFAVSPADGAGKIDLHHLPHP